MTALVWVEWSRDFWRSECGRFDVWLGGYGLWVCVDWECGRKARYRTLDEAKEGCAKQAAKSRNRDGAPSTAV